MNERGKGRHPSLGALVSTSSYIAFTFLILFFIYLQADRIVANYPYRPPDAAAPSAPCVITKLVCLCIVSGLLVLTMFLSATTRPVGAAGSPLQARRTFVENSH